MEEDSKPILVIETRPSKITGISWFLMLVYKDRLGQDHSFEEQLPQDWASWEDYVRELHMVGAAGRLKEKLRPILIREDGEHLSLVQPVGTVPLLNG